MHITLPQQALCSDRRKVTLGPDPINWLLPGLPIGWSAHSFHFFVDWRPSTPLLGQNVWVTRLVKLAANESIEQVTSADLASVFASSTHAPAFDALGHISALYGQNAIAVLLPEIPVQLVEDRTPVWMIAWSAKEMPEVIATSLAELKALIQHESGGPVPIGKKGLIYGTSAVECALSHTDAAYPGDVDAVIVDDAGHIRCVIEYKKHNLDDHIGNHLINRYYPYPDGRKYRRLQSLVSHCRQSDPAIPFVVLYYSTKKPLVRLQEIGQLLPNVVTIDRDSGDLDIAGMTQAQVATICVKWLGITP